MIIPLGHEQTSVRRLPWVTFSIIVACTVTFILMAPGEHEQQMLGFLRLHQALGYFTQHPYLEIDERFLQIFAIELGDEKAVAFAEHMRRDGPRAPSDPERLQWEQRRFDTILDAYHRGLQESLLYRFGLVPVRLEAADLVTYQFLHTGWFHLLLNLLMLWVVAPFVEDVWGRPLFVAFYLAAGAVAGLMYAVRYPALEVPLVGASGAIAGVMGAFLVRYFRSQVRFLLWLGVPVGPFQAPAWVILPGWFGIQLLSAQAMDAVLRRSGGGGVGFWAHVWGFAFGVVFAAVMAHFRIEDRFIHQAIEDKVTLLENPAVDRAVAKARTGDVEGALEALQHEVAKQPDNVDAAMALWNLAVAHGETARAVEPMVRAILGALRSDDSGFVVSHWEEVLVHVPEVEIDPLAAVRIAEILDQEQRVVSAVETLELARQRASSSTPAAVLLRMARLGLLLEAPSIEAMVRAALEHPETPADARPELEVAMWGLARGGRVRGAAGPPADRPPATDPAAATSRTAVLEVTEAVPLALDGHLLRVDCSGHSRELDLREVQAVAVGVVARPGSKPIGVLDLLLDQPGAAGGARSLRVTSDGFDPRTMVGGEELWAAFRLFAVKILDASVAVPLPDWDAARGQPFRSYPSLGAYQRQVLGIEL